MTDGHTRNCSLLANQNVDNEIHSRRHVQIFERLVPCLKVNGCRRKVSKLVQATCVQSAMASIQSTSSPTKRHNANETFSATQRMNEDTMWTQKNFYRENVKHTEGDGGKGGRTIMLHNSNSNKCRPTVNRKTFPSKQRVRTKFRPKKKTKKMFAHVRRVFASIPRESELLSSWLTRVGDAWMFSLGQIEIGKSKYNETRHVSHRQWCWPEILFVLQCWLLTRRA